MRAAAPPVCALADGCAAGARRRAIARIMEARFLLVAFEEIRDAANWTR